MKKMFLIAFILRLFLTYFQYSGDIGNHIAWADSFLSQGGANYFERVIPGFNIPNYPPLSIYLFVASRLFYNYFFNLCLYLDESISHFPSFLIPLLETLNAQSAFMKLPAIVAGLAVGYLILKLTNSKFLSALYLFNPAVIYVSTVWGQIESLPIFFLLLSLYFYQSKKKSSNLGSHLAFTLAILSKQTALWLFPIYLMLWLRLGPKKFIQGIVAQVALFILLYLPFISSLIEPFSLYFQTLSGSSNLVADAAWNLWSFIVPASSPDSTLFGPFSIRTWSLLSLAVTYLFICYQFFKNKLDLYSSLFLLSLAAFFLQTRVHERHLAPTLVFALLLPIKLKPKLVVYLLLSLYHMLNLYVSLNLPFI